MKKIIAFILVVALLFTLSITAYAEESEIKGANYTSASTTFTISDSGLAKVTNKYVGKTGVFQSAKVTTKVQKKVGIIWVTVSGGSWTDTSTLLNFSKSHSVQLSSTGTYRAHVVFVISGTGGSDDRITKNVQKTYS